MSTDRAKLNVQVAEIRFRFGGRNLERKAVFLSCASAFRRSRPRHDGGERLT